MEWEIQKNGSKRRRWRKIVFFFILLFGGALLSKHLWFQEKPIPAEVELVRRGRVEALVPSISAGTIAPWRKALISAEYPGVVERLPVREGEGVQKGAILAQLDDREARSRVRSLEANLQTAIRRLEQARLAWKMSALVTEATLSQEKARLDEAERNFKRTQELFSRKLVPVAAMDQARTEYRVAQERFESAQAHLQEQEVKAEEIKVAQANVEQLTASLELARLQLDKMTIRAPFSGLITRLLVEEGEFIGMGTKGEVLGVATPIAELSDTSKLLVKAEIDEVDLGKIRLGQPVKVTLDAYPDQVFTGTLHQIAPRVDTTRDQNRTVQVEVEVSFAELRFAIGMSADIEILVDAADNTLMVPTLAINEGKEGKYVWTVKEGVVSKRPIQVGLSNWDVTEVITGVTEGEAVVVSLNRRNLQEGMRVKVVTASDHR